MVTIHSPSSKVSPGMVPTTAPPHLAVSPPYIMPLPLLPDTPSMLVTSPQPQQPYATSSGEKEMPERDEPQKLVTPQPVFQPTITSQLKEKATVPFKKTKPTTEPI
jgi:hypothetical protein